MDSPEPVTEPTAPQELPTGRDLEVRLLRVGYDDDDVLDGLSLDMPAGSRVVDHRAEWFGKEHAGGGAVAVPRAAGGEVLLDGVDLARLEGDQVRSVVGLLTQESHVFDTSIRENLLLAKPGASDLQLWKALYRARLGLIRRKAAGWARHDGGRARRPAVGW